MNATPKSRSTTAGSPRREPEGPEFKATVRYYGRMKPQRVYSLTVHLQPAGKEAGGAAEPVTVRLAIPGAHVVPTEERIDPGKGGATATFSVTPLARGRLTGARVEIVQQGRVVQDIRPRMYGTTQRLTWILALLTILVPFGLYYVTKINPVQDVVQVSVPDEDVKPGAGKEPSKRIISVTTSKHGRGLSREVRRVIKDVWPESIYRDEVASVAEPIGDNYQWLCDNAQLHNLYFVTAASLLGLTVLSWVTHLCLRSRLRKTLVLMPAGAMSQAAETLPLRASAGQPPPFVQPVD